jgi:general secretion pathway protein L
MSASPFTAARLGIVRKEAGEFLRWWVSELLAMLPAHWRSRLHLTRERLELRLSDDAIDARLVTADGDRDLGRFAPDAVDASPLVDTLGANRGKDRDLVLRLAGRSVLVHDLALPAAAEENLDQVLRYEMDRYTPFKADAVYHGSQVLGRDGVQGRIRVRLVVVPREFLDHWLRELRAWGIHPDRVEAEQAPGVDLAPASHHAASGGRIPSLRSILIGAMVLVLVVALLLPLWKLREVVVHLNREVAAVQQVAVRAQDLREERDRMLEQSRYLIDRKQTRYPVVTVLNEMAFILPDDTWVQSLQLNDRRVVIQGHSAAASALIGRIEASPLFGSVSFVAPVTRDRVTDKEVFQIALMIQDAER